MNKIEKKKKRKNINYHIINDEIQHVLYFDKNKFQAVSSTKKIKILIILILLFIILLSLKNTSFATAAHFYPKEYDITLLNISKNDIKEIEIFTPWGFFDDNDKEEIDGRLFNYNNYYYYGIKGKDYNGIDCKIIGTIKQNELEKIDSGIKFSIARDDYPFDDTFEFNLRILKNDKKEVYTESISQYTVIDEFSTESDVTEAKKIKDEIIYVVGNYNENGLWISPTYNDTDNYSVLKETTLDQYLNIIIIIILIIIITIFRIYKKNKTNI